VFKTIFIPFFEFFSDGFLDCCWLSFSDVDLFPAFFFARTPLKKSLLMLSSRDESKGKSEEFLDFRAGAVSGRALLLSSFKSRSSAKRTDRLSGAVVGRFLSAPTLSPPKEGAYPPNWISLSSSLTKQKFIEHNIPQMRFFCEFHKFESNSL